MPVSVSRIEPGLYLSRWVGTITMGEITGSTQDVLRLVDEDGVSSHVVILDGTEHVSIPLDLRGLRGNIPEGRLAVLVIGRSRTGELLASTITHLTRFPIEFHPTMESALARGRDLLSAASRSA